jgi:hypothetical protein
MGMPLDFPVNTGNDMSATGDGTHPLLHVIHLES